jgi:hypothetical protein
MPALGCSKWEHRDLNPNRRSASQSRCFPYWRAFRVDKRRGKKKSLPHCLLACSRREDKWPLLWNFYGFLRASIGMPLFANNATWPKPQNNTSKHLNRNANESKMHSTIDAPCIEWGMAKSFGFANATPFSATICTTLCMIPQPRIRLINPGIIPSTTISSTTTMDQTWQVLSDSACCCLVR